VKSPARWPLLILASLAWGGCMPAEGTPWEWDLPEYLEPPPVPDGKTVTVEKVELGRRLFFDVRLSGNQTQACGTCHQQVLGFSDGMTSNEGSTGRLLSRNSMALANLGWFTSYTWPNPHLRTLEEQALVPLVGDAPPELDAGSDLDRVIADLRSDSWYSDAFPAAFPTLDDPVGIASIADALAAFERTMLALDSPYDRWLQGDAGALTDEALRGLELFSSDELGCSGCHGGPLQSNATLTDERDEVFFNTGLYEVYPADALGLYEVTVDPIDFGRFRVPSLRNVAVTAPYFHDGTGATLDDVLDHYLRGGRVVNQGLWAGDGRENPYKDPRINGFELPGADREALLAFLSSLTDHGYLQEPTLADPFIE